MTARDRLGPLLAVAQLEADSASLLSATLKTAAAYAGVSYGTGAETALGRRCALSLAALETDGYGSLSDLLAELRLCAYAVMVVLREQGESEHAALIQRALSRSVER